MNQTDMLLLRKDYSEGVGSHGENLKRFTNQLNRYRQLYYDWNKNYKMQNYAQQDMVKDTVKNSNPEQFEKYSKRAKILFAISLLFSLLRGGTVLWLIFGIIVVAMLMSFEKTLNTQWIIVHPIIMVIISVVNGLMSRIYDIHFLAILLLLANILLFGAYFISIKNAKERSSSHSGAIKVVYKDVTKETRELEHELDQLRFELSMMWPKVEKEYDSLCQDPSYKLPDELWWKCPQNMLANLEEEIKREFSGDYFTTCETRAIKKTSQDAFAITKYEMAPLYDSLSPEKAVAAYYNNLNLLVSTRGGIILDFVTNFVQSKEGSKRGSYEVNMHSGLERMGHTADWLAVGNEIDEAYNAGQITKGDHDYLLMKYENAVHDDYLEMNKTQTVDYTQTVEIKENTTVWTGQALLLPDPNHKNGYIMMDYRCQPNFMFENINALANKYSITGVWGDYENRNAFFMAKVHQNFVECV